jgi:hypothetical protein
MKRNSYFDNLIENYYAPFIYKPNEKNHNNILVIAQFLVNNYLIGMEHLQQIKKDIEYMRQFGPTLITENDSGMFNRFAEIKLENRKIRISMIKLNQFKCTAA